MKFSKEEGTKRDLQKENPKFTPRSKDVQDGSSELREKKWYEGIRCRCDVNEEQIMKTIESSWSQKSNKIRGEKIFQRGW